MGGLPARRNPRKKCCISGKCSGGPSAPGGRLGGGQVEILKRGTNEVGGREVDEGVEVHLDVPVPIPVPISALMEVRD